MSRSNPTTSGGTVGPYRHHRGWSSVLTGLARELLHSADPRSSGDPVRRRHRRGERPHECGARGGRAPVARPADPVVLTGASLPKFVNGPRGPLVGFRWTGSAWAQLPIQIDERAVVNFGKIYNDVNVNFYGSDPNNFSTLVYTGDKHLHRQRPEPEVRRRRRAGVHGPRRGRGGAGRQPTRAAPPPSTGVQIKVTDPLDPGAEGYVVPLQAGRRQRRCSRAQASAT